MARRRQLSAAVSFLAVCLLGSLALARAVGIHPAEPVLEPCVDAEEREHIRKLTLDSIDEALKIYVRHLFDIWMVDTHEQPRRATVGFHLAVAAHMRSRANALKWDPPVCEK